MATPLFAGVTVAERIERAEVQLIFAAAQAARRRTGAGVFAIGIAEGLASFAGRSSPFTKVAGLGFGGVPAAADLEWLEGAYAVGCDTYVDRMRRTIGGLSRLPGGGAAGHGPRHVARGGARSIRRWRSA